jgi:hypothetical protein
MYRVAQETHESIDIHISRLCIDVHATAVICQNIKAAGRETFRYGGLCKVGDATKSKKDRLKDQATEWSV